MIESQSHNSEWDFMSSLYNICLFVLWVKELKHKLPKLISEEAGATSTKYSWKHTHPWIMPPSGT